MKKIDELRGVLENREEGYGGSATTLNDIAMLWSSYLTMRTDIEFALDAATVAEMMVLLKIARSTGKETDGSKDDRLDIAGYAILSAELQDGAEAKINNNAVGFQLHAGDEE